MGKIGGLDTITNVKIYDVPFSLRENHCKIRKSILWKMEIGKTFIEVLGYSVKFSVEKLCSHSCASD